MKTTFLAIGLISFWLVLMGLSWMIIWNELAPIYWPQAPVLDFTKSLLSVVFIGFAGNIWRFNHSIPTAKDEK